MLLFMPFRTLSNWTNSIIILYMCIGIGESGNYEVSVLANTKGAFHVKVLCSIKGSPTDIHFQVVGRIEVGLLNQTV